MLYKNDAGSPDIQLLDTSDSDEHNGSLVKVYIKSRRDLTEFKNAVDYQLKYFDNVYVKGYNNYNNEYTVFQGKTFKFRTDVDLDTKLHLCIGKVTYPIDWTKLGLEQVNLPFGLYFNIGELPITPERESVKYVSIEKDGVTTSTVEVIKKRIEELFEELSEFIQDEDTEHNNLIDWYTHTNSKFSIKVSDVDIPIKNSKLKRKPIVYTPFEELGIPEPNYYPFPNWQVFKYYRHGILKEADEKIGIPDLSNYYLIRVLKPISRFKKITLDYLQFLASNENKALRFIKPIKTSSKEIRSVLINGSLTKKEVYSKLDYTTDNLLTLWKKYKNTVNKEIILNSTDYESVVISEDYKISWEARNNTKTTLTAEDGEIIVENMRNFIKTSRRQTLSLSTLNDYKGFILYGFNKEEVLLESYAKILNKGEFAKPSICSILKIKVSDEKHFISLPNTINVTSFMTPNPIFKKIASAAIVNKSSIWNYEFLPDQTVHKVNSKLYISLDNEVVFIPLATTIKKLKEIKDNTIVVNNDDLDTSLLLETIVEVAETNDWIEPEVKTDLQKVENYLKGLDLINYIVGVEEALPHVIDFFKLSGKKVNPEWTKLEQWQIDIIEDSKSKFDYLELVSSQITIIGSEYHSDTKKRASYFDTKRKKEILSSTTTKYKKNLKELQILTNYHGNKATVN